MSLSKEWGELVAAVRERVPEGQSPGPHIQKIVREAFDVVGAMLKSGRNIDEIANEAVAGFKSLVGLFNPPGWAAEGIVMLVTMRVPSLVWQMAPYADQGQAFFDEVVVPPLDQWLGVLADCRNDLSSGPAKVYVDEVLTT